MDELVTLCQIMLSLLDKLLVQGCITKEEYDKHIKLKIEFLEMQKGME